jgi:type II secretory pathway pseudopilin PulG
MSSIYFKRLAASVALGIIAILGTSVYTDAQGRRNDSREQREAAKAQERIAKSQAKTDRRNALLQRQRQAAWTARNRRIVVTRSGNDRSNGQGYYMGNANANTNRDGRYRVYRNGSYYNTNQQGADLLRHAVNQGYQQGFQAGRADNRSGRNMSWSNSRVYQTGTYGYQSYVDQSQYRYYFQQGFQRGYQDGTNTQYRDDYNGDFQYGRYDNGSPNILETILNQVLRIQSY